MNMEASSQEPMDQQAVEHLREHVRQVMNTFRRERNEAREQASTAQQNYRELQKQIEMMEHHIRVLTEENDSLRMSYQVAMESTTGHTAMVSEMNVLKAANILQGETVNTVTDQLEEQTMQMAQLQNIQGHLHQLVGQHEQQIESQQEQIEQHLALIKQQQTTIDSQQKTIESLRRRPLPSTNSSANLITRENPKEDSGESSENPTASIRALASRPLPQVNNVGSPGRPYPPRSDSAPLPAPRPITASPPATSPPSTLRDSGGNTAKYPQNLINNPQIMAAANASIGRRPSTGHSGDSEPPARPYRPPSKSSFAATRPVNVPIPAPAVPPVELMPQPEEELLLITNAEGNKEVKGGSIFKLVERLTPSVGIVDTEYLNAFFLTYRSFTTGEFVLGLILKRYDTDQDQIIRLRVIDVLRRWLTDYYMDFAENPTLMEKVKEFANTNITKHHNDLLTSINKCISNQDRRGEIWAEVPMPPTIVPKSPNVTDFDPVEFSRQMCLQDFALLAKIKQIELLQKPRPNLDGMIKRFNAVSSWIATQIVNTENFTGRVKLVKHFLKVAKELQNMGNFNGLMQIMSGLQSAAVHRLYKTWEKITKSHYNETFEFLKSLTSTKDNYHQYRQALKLHPAPSVPFVGVALTDLTFIEDGMKNEIEGRKGVINFQKRKKMSMVVDTIINCQQTPYRFNQEKTIQGVLENCESLTQSLMWQQSLKCEPRQPEK